jgi:hydrogenase/urease accessory protein HupE
MIIMTIATVVFLILTDLIQIYQQKRWKLFWVYSLMIVSVIVLAILISFDIRIPSPAVPLKNAVKAIFGLK